MKLSDHDLLQRVDEKVDGLITTVNEMRTGTVQDISMLKKDKADKDVVEELRKKVEYDIENRVRKLEDKSNTGSGERKAAWLFYMIIGAITMGIIGLLTFLAQAGLIKL
jgi:hypothetical protein